MHAESLRVQFYLSALGQNTNVGDKFAWTQKQESVWAKDAISSLLIGATDEHSVPKNIVKAYWIDDHLLYHKKAKKRNMKKHRTDEILTRMVFVLSMIVFAVVVVFELPFINRTGTPLFQMPNGEIVTIRSMLLVLVGAASSATAFLSHYYGKLSLARKCLDSEKMALLYTAAQKHFDDPTIDKAELFLKLTREELIENRNWFSYCRENNPTFDM